LPFDLTAISTTIVATTSGAQRILVFRRYEDSVPDVILLELPYNISIGLSLSFFRASQAEQRHVLSEILKIDLQLSSDVPKFVVVVYTAMFRVWYEQDHPV
jgi:hypothetical protein